MEMRPCLHSGRRTVTRAQQKLAQPMTSSQLILLGRLARPHQVAQRLRTLIRNPDRRQIAGSIASRQLLGITPIGLHPVAGLHRNQGRRNHLTLTPNSANCQYST